MRQPESEPRARKTESRARVAGKEDKGEGREERWAWTPPSVVEGAGVREGPNVLFETSKPWRLQGMRGQKNCF